MTATSAPTLPDPRDARAFRCVRCGYRGGTAELVYAFDDGPELVERIRFPDAPGLPPARAAAFGQALHLLHLVAGVSYYKAGVPAQISVGADPLDAATASLVDAVYVQGLAEFQYRNGLDLRGRIVFPHAQVADAGASAAAPALGLPRRVLVPVGGGKDSLVAVEALRATGIDATVAWVGASPLIAAVAARTGLPALNIGRELSPVLFDYNRMGAWNGHVPVTAINSAILACAAVLYGFDAIAFANERSASVATLEYAGRAVNHQWSKSWEFETALATWLRTHVAADLDYFSLLRPFAELAVTRAFARSGAAYFDVFSSCNRNFRILGPKPADRWCG
ncbi:MAG TPA: endonuclease domain-containing protein, partial [Rhodanobacteraceae bacterium]